MLKLFFLENKSTQRIEDWGDYGDVLWSGFADRDSNGHIVIERAGPFTPSIYATLNFFICTRKMELPLRKSGIRGVDFIPVEKRKIVHVDWQNFPAASDIHDLFPDINEPDELLTALKNDGHLRARMPEYRAIMPTSSIEIRRIAPYNYRTRHASIEAYDVSEDLGDIVSADTHSGYFVTDRGKDILAKLGGDFLEFIPLKVAV
jgi:hypothetical protein